MDLLQPYSIRSVLFAILVAAAPSVWADEQLPERVEFNRDIRPVLADVCFHCHGPDQAKRQAGLRFDTQAGATADLGDGRRAIKEGQPEKSELVRRIETTEPDTRMPPLDSERQLTSRQRALFRRWIEQGAKWDAHWSFVSPARVDPPVVKATDWPKSLLDQFVLFKLEQELLHPSPATDKSTLLRRVTLDLTGLPSTTSEVDDFLNDRSPDAFDRVVDRLLASPRYGERMAVRWLNAARYADTSGYQSDGERIMWRWRDWVIDAFNQNMPFDQFTIEQLAGDLLPGATLNQRIATGFNRNHRGNAEGGIIPEEYAVEYVVDRAETTATVWLGLTAMCARCHNHKYDPLSQAEFYQLFAFFNNIPEKGRAIKIGNSPPYLVSPTREQDRRLAQLNDRVSRAEVSWNSLQSQIALAQAAWEHSQAANKLPAANAVARGLIVHFPLDGATEPATIAPTASARPAAYLGEPRTLPLPATDKPAPIEKGNPAFNNARMGQGLAIAGHDDAAVGDVANFGFFDKFSIACWIRPDDARGGTILSRMTDVQHGDGWSVVLDGQKIQVHFTKRWLDDACRVESLDSIPPGEWRHVSVTYDGSRVTSGIRIFVNGVPQQTVTLLDELNQSFASPQPLRIGGGNGPQGRFHGMIDDVRIFDRVLSDDDALILTETLGFDAIVEIPAAKRTPSQSAALREYFVQTAADESIKQAWQEVHAARDELDRFQGLLPSTMVMVELPTPREAHVLLRGEYDKPGARVTAQVPQSLPPLPNGVPQNRLGLAQWLVDANHPLTSRVAVNRYWQMFFGTGLVKTVDDFGQQGEWPSHPQLLDWLALEFQGPKASSLAWDTKRLLRKIVTSATYQQSSQMTDQLQHRDPENRWLARGPRFRLPAEMVRDQALAVSGLLVEQPGGPSVKPYQPDGLWKDLAGVDYVQDHGPSLYRRSLYTFWKRTIAPPSMITFDAAGRETCIVKETRTNTPLQALNLMNDVAYVEAARKLGERMLLESDSNPANRIAVAYRRVLGRQPKPAELSIVQAAYVRHWDFYRSHPADADALTNQGESPRNTALDISELAACTTVAGLIMNLDEAVTRE